MACFSKPQRIVEKSKKALRGVFGQCYINAYINKTNIYKHLNLRVVFGSLGLAGHFEYGGKYHTAKDFYKNPFDSHAWLEDDDGNVYDIIFPQYRDIARFFGKNPTFPVNWEVAGISKEDLLEEGLEHIPAPKTARADIIRNVEVLLS